MNKPIRKHATVPPSFECGQVWQMADSSLRIGLVGKRLVHYKQFKGKSHARVSTSLAGIGELEKYLRQNKAILATNRPDHLRHSSTSPGPASRVR